MKKRYCKLLLLFLVFSNISFSQSSDAPAKKDAILFTCDSFYKVADYDNLKKTAETYLAGKSPLSAEQKITLNYYAGIANYNLLIFDTALLFQKKCFDEAKAQANTDFLGKSGMALMVINMQIGDTAQAKLYKKELQAIVENESVPDKEKLLPYLALGLNYQRQMYFGTAQDYFLKGMTLHELAGLTDAKERKDYANLCVLLSNVYRSMNYPDKALEVLNKGKAMAMEHETYAKLWLNSMIEVFTMPGYDKTDSALFYLDILQNKYPMKNQVGNENVEPYGNIALSYINLKKYDSAKIYADIIYTNATKSQLAFFIFQAQMVKGFYATETGDYETAISELEKSKSIAQQVGPELYVEILRYLAKAWQKKDANKSFEYYDEYVEASTKMVKEKQSINFADQETRYRTVEKQKQIESKNLQLVAARKQRIGLIAGLVLLSLLALMLVSFYRNKKKTAKLLDKKNRSLSKLNSDLEEANQTKAKLFSIIGHDLRSPISQVYQFLKLQQLNPDALNTEQKNELSNKIQTATGSLLETMEDLLLWSKTQLNEFKTSVEPVALLPVIETCKQLLQLNSEAKNISYQQTIEPTDMANTDIYFLQTIIRNLLQNAIKASPQNGTIEIFARQENSYLTLFIKNGGIPFTQAQYQQAISNELTTTTGNGLGLRLIDELSQKINATVKFTTPSEGGSQVEVRLEAV